MPGSKGSKKLSKTAFVRSLPATLTAKEVVEKAKAKGLTISAGYVYTIRTNSRRKKAGVPKTAARPSSPRGNATSETTFRKLIFEIGVRRARALVDEVDAKIQALIAGH